MRKKYLVSTLLLSMFAPLYAGAQTITLSSSTNYESRAELMSKERDHELYAQAFALAESGYFAKLEEVKTQIADKSLMPYLEYKTLLQSNDKDRLINWYSKNNNLYGAEIIYQKLKRIGVDNISAPKYPVKKDNVVIYKPPRELSAERAPYTTQSDIKSLENIATLFRSNKDIEAINLANLQGNSGVIGRTSFFGGLASFRQGQFENALQFFDKTAFWEYGDDYTKSSGAFWAARAAARLGKRDLESKYLAQAASMPFTFYGQLAMMRLGMWENFSVPNSNKEVKDLYQIIENNQRVKHAIELYDIGQKDMASFELRAAWLSKDGDDDFAYQIIAQMLEMNDLGAEIAKSTVFTGISNAYPLPLNAKPKGGDFVLDRALIFGVMRQESRFQSGAVSYAGARGLMQVMPATAAWFAKRPEFRDNPGLLHDDAVNISLGEGYLEYVLGLNNNSVARALMAYNAGPGNVNKWTRNISGSNDTLMFIEATPNTQAREYVKKVMTNMWVYHKRLGQYAPTLEKLAFDQSPDYEPQDNPRLAARNSPQLSNAIALKTVLNK